MIKPRNDVQPAGRRTGTARRAVLQANLGRQFNRGTRLPYQAFTSPLGLAFPVQPKVVRVTRWESEYWRKDIRVRLQPPQNQPG